MDETENILPAIIPPLHKKTSSSFFLTSKINNIINKNKNNPFSFFPTPAPQQPEPEQLTYQDITNILQTFTRQNLIQTLSTSSPIPTTTNFKIFLTSLHPSTTTQDLLTHFSPFGEIAYAKVVHFPNTNLSKGFGFVTFKTLQSFLSALKQPSKRINGCVVFARPSNPEATPSISPKKDGFVFTQGRVERCVFVGNVPVDMECGDLVKYFEKYGEIEEGPGWRYDYNTNNNLNGSTGVISSRGCCFIAYKFVVGARNAVLMEMKKCKFGRDNNNMYCVPVIKDEDHDQEVKDDDHDFEELGLIEFDNNDNNDNDDDDDDHKVFSKGVDDDQKVRDVVVGQKLGGSSMFPYYDYYGFRV